MPVQATSMLIYTGIELNKTGQDGNLLSPGTF